MGVHRDAEFTASHLPAFMRGKEPEAWLTVYPFVRSYDWYILPDDERRQMLADHGRKGAAAPQVLSNTVASFALGDYEWILALEAPELVDLVDLMRAPPADRGPPPRARRGAVLHRPPHRPRRDRRGAGVSAPSRSVLRIGTRGSALALTQTGMVADDLADATGVTTELVTITTDGDRSNEPLSRAGGTGLFTGALRDALLAGECDVIVHSLKDLPTAPHDRARRRRDPGARRRPRRALRPRRPHARTRSPHGARVGTGSPRRMAQLRAPAPRSRGRRHPRQRRHAPRQGHERRAGCRHPRRRRTPPPRPHRRRHRVPRRSTAGRPPRARARSRSRCAAATRTSSAPSTTPRPAPPSRPSARARAPRGRLLRARRRARRRRRRPAAALGERLQPRRHDRRSPHPTPPTWPDDDDRRARSRHPSPVNCSTPAPPT